MKKILLLVILIIVLSCSKSDDNSINSNSDNKINLPTWLKGTYKANEVNINYPYPQTNPYSLNFIGNDIVVKGTKNSTEQSMQAFIDNLKTNNKLKEVVEEHNTNSYTNYTLIIKYGETSKDDPYSTWLTYEITKQSSENELHVSYDLSGSGQYNVMYTKQ